MQDDTRMPRRQFLVGAALIGAAAAAPAVATARLRVPGAPAITSVTDAGPGRVSCAFSARPSTERVTAYQVRAVAA